MSKQLIITSALPYANGPLHFGHLLEHVQTDIWVRTNKLLKKDCIYLCASDAHGTPVMMKAELEKLKPEDLVNKITSEHEKTLRSFFIDHDNYFTTHSEENKKYSELIFQRSKDKNLVEINNNLDDKANTSALTTGLAGKQDTLTFGISNGNSVKINGSATNDLYAKFTNTGITSSTISDMKTDLGISNVSNESKASMLDSATLTGVPTAPNANANTNSTQIANTKYVDTAISNLVDGAGEALNTLSELSAALGDDSNFSSTVTNSLSTKAPINAPTFTGDAKAVTALASDNSTSIATTEYVTRAISNGDFAQQSTIDASFSAVNNSIDSKASLTGANFTGTVSGITKSMVGLGNVTNESKGSMFSSPNFTGTPTIDTTPSSSDNSTKIATTAFVKTATDDLVDSAPGTMDTLKKLADALGNDPNFSTTVTNSLGVKAPNNSPSFTGTPTAVTADIGTDNTQLATTAFVANAISGLGTGDVTKAEVDVSLNLKADLNAPTFTGNAKAVTALESDNSTKIATTAFVKRAVDNLVDSAPGTLNTLN